MSKDTKPETKAAAHPRAPDPLSLSDPIQEHLETALACHEAMLKGLLEIASETLAFAGRRTSANLELCTAVGACRSADDLLQVQARFATAASEEYLEQCRRLIDLSVALHRSVSQGPER